MTSSAVITPQIRASRVFASTTTEVRKQSVNKTVITIVTVAGGERPNHIVSVRVTQQTANKMQVRTNFVLREKS